MGGVQVGSAGGRGKGDECSVNGGDGDAKRNGFVFSEGTLKV